MEQDLAGFRDHTAVLKRRWRVLALFVVLGVVAGVALSMAQARVYTSETKLLLENQIAASTGSVDGMQPEEVATQAEVVVSDVVANRVIDNLGLDETTDSLIESVTVAGVEDKRILMITASRPNAEEAAAVANAFAEEYVALRTDRATRTREAVSEAYIGQLSEIKLELTDLRRQVRGVGPNRRAQLRVEVDSLQARQAELQAALLTAEDPAAALSTGGEVLQSAETPKGPSEPKPIRAGLLGLVVGLILGTLWAYLRDRSDDGIRNGQRLSSAVMNAPVLGRIPVEARAHRRRASTVLAPQSPVSEAYRTLNTNVRFLLASGDSRNGPAAGEGRAAGLVMVASASPGEGKTSVATNLAVAAARVGINVILVDADLRGSSVAQRFGVDIPDGLSDVLRGEVPLEPHLHDVGVPNLRVLAGGGVPPNPAELLASPRARVVWKELRAAADLVIIDTPPILRVTDPLELVREVDEIILVAREGRSRAGAVQAAAERIRQVGGRPSGVVLNCFTGKVESYGYGRASEPPL